MSENSPTPRRELTLFDSTCIIVGIIVASSIYCSSPMIARAAGGISTLIGLWLLGGLLSLIGALCYTELATAYPHEGGDYVYLTRAMGRPVGFLYAWCQLWIVRPGSIGAMAYIFAVYANQIWPNASPKDSIYVYCQVAYAAGAVVVLTAINMLGVREGKWTQNILTVIKIIGLAAIVVVGCIYTMPEARTETALPETVPAVTAPVVLSVGSFFEYFRKLFTELSSAMIFILFAYGGWNEMAFVSAEVKNPRKNILRALLIGTLAVTAVYLLVTFAFIHAMGYAGLCKSNAVAADVLSLAIGRTAGMAAGKIISLLICISALGAINGQIFTGSRIYYAMGKEHRLYSWLARWNERRDVPTCSMVIQGVITLAFVVWFGMAEGQNGFEKMVIFTTPGFWFFLALVGVSIFILRWRDSAVERPYRVPGYPVTPILFILSCGFMVKASVDWARMNPCREAIVAIIAIFLVGVVACGVNWWMERE